MRTFSRLVFFVGFIFATMVAVSSQVHCQEQKDHIIVTVGVGADELNNLVNTVYEYDFKVAVNAKIIGSKARLGGKFVFDKLPNIKRYSAGPEVSYHFSFVEPYGHFLIGAETYDGLGQRQFKRTIGAGVRLNFGHFVFNPFQIDSIRGVRAPFGSPGVNQFSASAGIRF
jgi:hypothetical protein